MFGVPKSRYTSLKFLCFIHGMSEETSLKSRFHRWSKSFPSQLVSKHNFCLEAVIYNNIKKNQID